MIYFKQFLCVFIRLLEKSKIFVGKNVKHFKIVKKIEFLQKTFSCRKTSVETTELKDVNCVV